MGTTSILFTDVVDSTFHMQNAADDDEAVRELTAHLRRCRSVIEQRGGEVVKLMGDGVMAVFPSAIGAVLGAIALQQAADWDRRHAHQPFEIRIGVNVGETISDTPNGDDDLFGIAVVVAQRLCASAGAGEIRISEIAQMLIGSRGGYNSTELGKLELKGLAEPLTAYSVQWEPLPDRAPVRTVVADDVVLIRTGVARLLADEGFEIVGEAGNFDDLISVVRRNKPAFVVTDIRMPPTLTDEGLRAAALLRSELPGLAVMVLSQHVEPAASATLLAADPTAIGYLLKERVSELDEFVESCRTVASGGCVIDPLVTERLVRRATNDAALSRLSEREREALELLAQGRSNSAIARELHCSAKTLETHIRSIFIKLDLAEHPDEHRRVAAVVKWLHRD